MRRCVATAPRPRVTTPVVALGVVVSAKGLDAHGSFNVYSLVATPLATLHAYAPELQRYAAVRAAVPS